MDKRKILEDVNGYLIEKLQEVPNMARLNMGLTGRFILGRDHVVKLDNKSAETSGEGASNG